MWFMWIKYINLQKPLTKYICSKENLLQIAKKKKFNLICTWKESKTNQYLFGEVNITKAIALE